MAWLKEINSYTQNQKRALLIVWFAIIVVFAYDFFHNQLIVNTLKKPQIDALQRISPDYTKSSDEPTQVELRTFDPNSDPYDTLVAKGVPKRIALSVTKLREYGKVFTSVDDLKKLYGMNDSLLARLLPHCRFPKKKADEKLAKNKQKIVIKETFDPNLTSYEKMVAIGIPEPIAKTIRNYVDKGGRFKTPGDLMKLYNIDSAAFEQIKPHITITTITKEEITLTYAELNTASYSHLKKVLEADSETIWKIINYRKRLGGYYTFEQLSEIDQLHDSIVKKMKTACWIDTLQIQHIRINQADYSQLIRHPYLSKDEVETIIRYRNFAKRIRSFDELIKNKVLGRASAQKLNPYISFE